jgi:hypothetical protein
VIGCAGSGAPRQDADVMAAAVEALNERLSEKPAAAGDEDAHVCSIRRGVLDMIRPFN